MNRKAARPDYNYIVMALADRAHHLLKREALVGHGSNVTGSARLKDEELHLRLARLHDQVQATSGRAREMVQTDPKAFDMAALLPLLTSVTRILERDRFKGIHVTTLWNMLTGLCQAISDILDLIAPGLRAFGARIDRKSPLHTLTPGEVEALFGEKPLAQKLLIALQVEADLRLSLRETRSLLAGRFGRPQGGVGPHEKRRGRWIAAQMIGMGVGLGLEPTRSGASAKISSCDAAIDARDRTRLAAGLEDRSVLNEIPSGYDAMEHIWRDATDGSELGQSAAIGRKLGVRLITPRPKTAN